jgi:hypothetical protein
LALGPSRRARRHRLHGPGAPPGRGLSRSPAIVQPACQGPTWRCGTRGLRPGASQFMWQASRFLCPRTSREPGRSFRFVLQHPRSPTTPRRPVSQSLAGTRPRGSSGSAKVTMGLRSLPRRRQGRTLAASWRGSAWLHPPHAGAGRRPRGSVNLAKQSCLRRKQEIDPRRSLSEGGNLPPPAARGTGRHRPGTPSEQALAPMRGPRAGGPGALSSLAAGLYDGWSSAASRRTPPNTLFPS